MDAPLVISRLESFEGRVPYLYLCTGGEVTVGIGHAIQTPADVLQLTWSIDGRPATAVEIQGDRQVLRSPYQVPHGRCRYRRAGL
jgi:GH24 family phage-related lysozyme (muramidase)